jgi:hypothetical protein
VSGSTRLFAAFGLLVRIVQVGLRQRVFITLLLVLAAEQSGCFQVPVHHTPPVEVKEFLRRGRQPLAVTTFFTARIVCLLLLAGAAFGFGGVGFVLFDVPVVQSVVIHDWLPRMVAACLL